MTEFTPREIVSELDRHIVGQGDAKKAVAIALRNRWRRRQLEAGLREEVMPKNILMIGPTGVGKTEISRRLARLAGAPFIKVEATKFTEVGYVGRDVDQIARDLVEVAITLVRESRREAVKAQAEAQAEDRVVDALVGPGASPATRESFRKRLRAGELDDKDVEIELNDAGGMPMMDIPGMPGGGAGVINLGDILGKGFGKKTKTVRMKVKEAYEPLLAEEADKLLDDAAITADAIKLAEEDGIVFLDEIDKIVGRSDARGADVSREGVQRDLLPLIEGTSVTTKHGVIKTDHILFIASGAFHLTEPEASLITQYVALMGTEGVTLDFTDEAIDALAALAHQVNASVENIGARRLQTVMEKLVEEISFTASDRDGETIVIDPDYVATHVGNLAKNVDLSKFIL